MAKRSTEYALRVLSPLAPPQAPAPPAAVPYIERERRRSLTMPRILRRLGRTCESPQLVRIQAELADDKDA